MSEIIQGKPTVSQREVAIVDYLRDKSLPSTAREIYEDVSKAIDDNISRPAYYKLLDRLVAVGKIELIDADGVNQYVAAPHLHSTNRLTLDDIYEMLPFVENTETVARAIEAQGYFIQHKNTILKLAAEALTKEVAAKLFFIWIKDLCTMLQKDLVIYQAVEQDGPFVGKRVLADPSLERRIHSQCETLRNILYRQLSIPRSAVDISDWDAPGGLKSSGQIYFNEEKLEEILNHRVFGVGESKTFIGLVSVSKPILTDAAQEMIISASDGSFHAGSLGIRTAKGYIEDESFVVTFNNSVAYVRSSEKVIQQKGHKRFFHSAPLTRQTLDDPAYKGMVLAPFMFPTLTPSEYEHMARTATDVVQMRVDEAVFSGKARDVATGEIILPPRVHFRDGTITPQERGFNHYYRMDPYGEITREGIILSQSILQRIMGSRGTPQVYAAAVKTTQIRLFSLILNWYIGRGSKLTTGKAIEGSWDIERSSFISDIDAMTMLLATLKAPAARDGFWMSCVAIREFPSLTDFYDIVLENGETWFDYLKDIRKRHLEQYYKYKGELRYHTIIGEDDLANDPYLYLLENGDYASFYIGHTFGEPAPKIPRYEFLCSLRKLGLAEKNSHVQRSMQLIATALLTSGFTEDRDHNFMSRMSIMKLVPSVIYRAHEFAKHMGKKLEGDFKSAVIARLASRRKQVLGDGDVELRPFSVKQYLERFSSVRKFLPPPEQLDDR
jgi:Fe2+ or Zn2+ uptake regulation protein